MRVSAIKGFTLVELLVVIVLIGLITSFTLLSNGTAGIDRELEEEAKRLHALVKLVQEESIVQAKEIAMEINKNDYSFLEQNENKWVQIKDNVFKPRTLKNEFKLTLAPDEQASFFKNEKTESLRIYFLSSGEQTPFTMTIKLNNREYPCYRLSGGFNGSLNLEYIPDPVEGQAFRAGS